MLNRTDPVWNKLMAAAFALPEDFQFEIESRGHEFNFYSKHSRFTPYELADALWQESLFNSHDAEGLIEAWQTHTPVTKLSFEIEAPNGYKSTHQRNRIPFSVSRYGSSYQRCVYCLHRDFYTDGFKIWPSHRCPYPEGIPVRVEIKVPSGKLMVGNDFRDEFPVADDFYVNELPEIARCIETYAGEANMAHFLVGNSCPNLYPTGEDRFVCANPAEDVPEGEDWRTIPGVIGPEVAGVCTDLWWVSIVDAKVAAERGLTEEGGPGWTKNYIVPVTPGIYVVDYYHLKRGFDRDEYPVVYADIYRRVDA